MSHPKRPSVFHSFNLTDSKTLSQELAELMTKRHLKLTLSSMQCTSGWQDDPETLKACVRLHHRLGQFEQSEAFLEQLYRSARRTEDRFFALTHLAVGFLRRDRLISAYSLALRAMTLDRSSVTPWLIAAAAVGKLGDETVLKCFIPIFGRMFEDFRKFPAVVSALMTNADLEAFVCSEPYLSQLEDRVCEAAEWLELHGGHASTSRGDFSNVNEALFEELSRLIESRYPSPAHELRAPHLGMPTDVRKSSVN